MQPNFIFPPTVTRQTPHIPMPSIMIGVKVTTVGTPNGMGMCGVCRVTVGGKMKFGCIDGPEFDGHKVDFEQLIKRQRMMLPEERLTSELWEIGECACGRSKA